MVVLKVPRDGVARGEGIELKVKLLVGPVVGLKLPSSSSKAGKNFPASKPSIVLAMN